MKVQQVLNCQVPSWYPHFKEVTIKSKFIELPKAFLDYLHSDETLVLPEGSLNAESVGRNSDDSGDDWDADCHMRELVAPKFPEVDEKIKCAINALGGKVFPKLNWSSPKDASWIGLNNSLACTCAAEIYLLLKSSDFIVHDLTQPFEECEDLADNRSINISYSLCLRRWHNLSLGGEFRCFVKNNKVIGISQRHHNSHFPFIADQSECILEDIMDFYNRVIKGKFPDVDYVIDVYRMDKNKVYLMDFNPFGPVTDALMFTWEELATSSGNSDQPVSLRYVESHEGIQPSNYASYAFPSDVVDLATGSDPNKLIDFLKLTTQSQNAESSSDEEDNRSHDVRS